MSDSSDGRRSMWDVPQYGATVADASGAYVLRIFGPRHVVLAAFVSVLEDWTNDRGGPRVWLEPLDLRGE